MPRRLRALQDFSPAPGSLFEIPLKLNEVVELIEDGDAPDGWLLVQSGRRLTGLVGTQGLVPLTFLEEIEAAPDESASDAAATEAPGAAAPEAANDGGADDPLDQSERRRRERLERENKRIAIANFHPEPGSVFEVPMQVGETPSSPTSTGRRRRLDPGQTA